MKKLILITTLVTSITSSALAKTEGNQVGIDLLRSSASHQYKSSNTIVSNYRKFDDSNFGVGINYKYAINFGNNIFIAPGVFAEKINTKTNDQDGDPTSLSYRYGAKLDLGYDVTDQVAIYATGGFASVNYKVDWTSIAKKKSGNEAGFVYGVGVAYNITKNFALNLEYNFQNLDLKTPTSTGINRVDSDLSVLKLGAAYRF